MHGGNTNYVYEIASAYTEGTPRTVQPYDDAEQIFSELLKASSLNEHVRHRPCRVRLFNDALEKALAFIQVPWAR